MRASKRLIAKVGLLVSVFSISPISPATAAACAVSSSISGANTILLVTATGACEVTIPAGTSTIQVEAWGAGGGSMGQDNGTGASSGGAYAISSISVTGYSTLYLSVGAGGIGGISSGAVGGDSWVNLSNTAPTSSSTGVKAKGGSGAPITSPNNSTQLSSSVGTTIYIGGAGGIGAEGGGGASASPSGNGGAGSNGNGGAGGSSPSAGAGGSAGGTSLNGGDGISNVNGGGGGGGSYNNRGGMGGLPGGGGGAGYTNSSVNPSPGYTNTNTVHGYGGDGGRGQVRLTYATVAAAAPTVSASSLSNLASNLKSSTATLNGAVNANGISTTTSFEYSTSAVLADTQTVSSTTLSSSSETAITGNITGLLPSKIYYFRAKAVNSSGTTYGSIFSFSTFPTINLQPTNDTTTAGLTDSFTVGTTSLVSPQTRAIKWQVATDTVTAVASVAWANVTSGNGSGFTTETLTTSTLTTAMNKYRYRAIVTFTDTSTTHVETSTVVTLTVNPAISFTSTTSAISQTYGAARPTRTVTFSGGTDTRTVSATFTSLASGRITFDTSTALFTVDTRTAVGTYLDTITVTDAKGATASYVQTITITVADTLTVTSDTPTALTYTGAAAVFTDSVTVISGLVSGDVVSGAEFYNYTNIGGTTYGPSTTKPTNAGTYTITPSVLTFSSGAASNYAAITYRTSTLTINKAAQAALSVIPLYQPFFSNPTSTTLLVTGGSDNGAVSYTYVPSLSTAGGCALSGANNSTITVTSDGTCRIVATKAATDNYLAAVSDTGTVTFHFYISNFGTPRAQEYPSEIVLVGGTDVVYQVETPPVISSASETTQAEGGLITLTGSGFTGTTSVKIKGLIANFVVNSDTSLTLTVPTGLAGRGGRIVVENAKGISISETLFTFTAPASI